MKPLVGKRILTLAMNLPGPLAVARLRELGARVVKIEPPSGDPFSDYATEWYEELMRGVEVIRLDLKSPQSSAALGLELDRAQLLITSMRAAALARCGLDDETVSRKFPHLSAIRITGYSEREDAPGHDITYQAGVGLVNPPQHPSSLFADLFAAERVFSAALQLFLVTKDSGKGTAVTVSIEEAVSCLRLPMKFGLVGPSGLLGGGDARYGLYETNDGWIALAALEPHFWERLLETLDIENADRESLASKFASETTEFWVSLARERDLPISAVRPP